MINNISAANFILFEPHCTAYELTNKATRRFKRLNNLKINHHYFFFLAKNIQMPKVSRLSEEDNTSNVWVRKSKAFSNEDL